MSVVVIMIVAVIVIAPVSVAAAAATAVATTSDQLLGPGTYSARQSSATDQRGAATSPPVRQTCYASNMKSVLEVARELAARHQVEDPETREVFVADSPDVVRLLEVSSSVGSWGKPEVLPVRFAPKPEAGIPYASNVILLSPEDWAEVQAGRVQLPADWGDPMLFRKIA